MIDRKDIGPRIMIVMRVHLWVGIAGMLLSSVAIAEVKPVDTRTPVFRIYVAVSSSNQQKLMRGPQVSFDSKRALLVISSARDVRPNRDGKSIVFVLTDRDAKAFAAISRKYMNGLLIVEGQGRVLTVLHITEPLDNGALEFRDPDDAPVNQYLRQRFNLAARR